MVTPGIRGSEGPLVVFAGGGTGGHLYPALAVAQALRERLPNVRVSFFCTQRPIDRRVLGAHDWQRIEQPLVSLQRAPWRWLGVYLGFRKAGLLCRSRFAADRPAVVVGTGGLGSIPAVREAARAGIPAALLNPDALPGRANRYLASRAEAIFTQWPTTTEHLPRAATVLVTGCPVRAEFLAATAEAGKRRFDLDATKKTLLVTGASQGARTINRAVAANLDFLESQRNWQVLHITGDLDYAAVCEAYEERSIPAVVLPFTEHMAEALAACDLVIARAGASFLAEITAVGRASILMPYPHHRDNHQMENARCVACSGGGAGARIVRDRVAPEENRRALREALEELMGDDGLRESMAGAARKGGRPDAAAGIAEHLLRAFVDVSPGRVDESLKALC